MSKFQEYLEAVKGATSIEDAKSFASSLKSTDDQIIKMFNEPSEHEPFTDDPGNVSRFVCINKKDADKDLDSILKNKEYAFIVYFWPGSKRTAFGLNENNKYRSSYKTYSSIDEMKDNDKIYQLIKGK